MAIQTLNTIKNWFRTGLKPTQSQFWDTWDSFRHKYDKVPVKDVEGIDELLNSKTDQSDFKTINGQSIIGNGDIGINGGGAQGLQSVLDNGNQADGFIRLANSENYITNLSSGHIGVTDGSSYASIDTSQIIMFGEVEGQLTTSFINLYGYNHQLTNLGVGLSCFSGLVMKTNPSPNAYFGIIKTDDVTTGSLTLQMPNKKGTYTLATLDDISSNGKTPTLNEVASAGNQILNGNIIQLISNDGVNPDPNVEMMNIYPSGIVGAKGGYKGFRAEYAGFNIYKTDEQTYQTTASTTYGNLQLLVQNNSVVHTLQIPVKDGILATLDDITGTNQNLQQVLDKGNVSRTKAIFDLNPEIANPYKPMSSIDFGSINVYGSHNWYGETQTASTEITSGTIRVSRNGLTNAFLLQPQGNQGSYFYAPNKSGGSYTLATTDDITLQKAFDKNPSGDVTSPNGLNASGISFYTDDSYIYSGMYARKDNGNGNTDSGFIGYDNGVPSILRRQANSSGIAELILSFQKPAINGNGTTVTRVQIPAKPAKNNPNDFYVLATTDDFKTINGNSILGEGNIVVSGNSTSGTFTPTLTNGMNIKDIMVEDAFWTKIGNVVTVTYSLNLNFTEASKLSSLRLSLPVKNTSAATNLGIGNLISPFAAPIAGVVQRDGQNSVLFVLVSSTDSNYHAGAVTLTYSTT